MSKLAIAKRLDSVINHPNADTLDLVTCGGYSCIVKRNLFKQGDLVIFINPDSVLPENEWTGFYKNKSNRVKAIRLRGEWSFGIVESFFNVGLDVNQFKENDDLTEVLQITKYEPPVPQDLNAKGLLPYGIPKTDEERYQSLDFIRYGEIVDVTRKMDGQSFSAYCKLNEDKSIIAGICGRTMEYKLDSINNYTLNEKKYNVLEKLKGFCLANNISLCIRGEQTGSNIQKSSLFPLYFIVF